MPQAVHHGAKPHKGLLELGFVKRIDFDIDGLIEVCYQISDKGCKALEHYLKQHGGKLPKARDKKASTNVRYLYLD